MTLLAGVLLFLILAVLLAAPVAVVLLVRLLLRPRDRRSVGRTSWTDDDEIAARRHH